VALTSTEDGVFMQSLLKLRDWLLQGKAGKTLRVIGARAVAAARPARSGGQS
jgi:hypothetical protein